jgi:hypothetical protein
MGRALGDGADGIAPGSRPGRAAPATEATSVLSAGRRAPAREPERTAVTSAVTPRKPRSGPARAAPVAQAAQAAPAARTRRRGRGRLMFALIALLALALVIVAVVVITAPASTQVKLRNVVYSDVQQAASALKQLVSENTK